MTVRVEVSAQVAAPPSTVFAAMVDLPSQDRWILATRLFPLAGGTPVPEVGSRIAAFTSVLGFGFLDVMVVSAFEPGRRWETRHIGSVVRGRGIFLVEAAPAGSRATWIEEVELPVGPLERMVWAFVRPLVAALARPLAAAPRARGRVGCPPGVGGGSRMTPDRVRCAWANSTPEYVDYHDAEWGVPLHGDDALFERMSLEAFQSGLSWLTILRKRPAFRDAFAGFAIPVVAAFDEHDVARLMADSGIVRNRAKIDAAIANARVAVALPIALDELIWSFAPASDRPRPRALSDVPAVSPESTALAKELKRRGFRFIGPTTAYAMMQAIGMVDDHVADCWRAAG